MIQARGPTRVRLQVEGYTSCDHGGGHGGAFIQDVGTECKWPRAVLQARPVQQLMDDSSQKARRLIFRGDRWQENRFQDCRWLITVR